MGVKDQSLSITWEEGLQKLDCQLINSQRGGGGRKSLGHNRALGEIW